MEIYYKDDEGKLQETSLKVLLEHSLSLSEYEMDNGFSSDDDTQWTGIIQESKKPSQVVINIEFKDDGNTITDIGVFESPIKTIIDDDNMKKII